MGDYTKRATTSRHICRHVRREERREQAAFRQRMRNTRTTDEQIELLTDLRPGASAREKARLTA